MDGLPFLLSTATWSKVKGLTKSVNEPYLKDHGRNQRVKARLWPCLLQAKQLAGSQAQILVLKKMGQAANKARKTERKK